MRIPTPIKALSAVAALALLAGCSGNGSALPASSITSQSHARTINFHAAQTGVAPKYLESIRFGRANHVIPNTPGPRDLAVTDFGTGGVVVLDHNYNPEGTINDSTFFPDGNFYDNSAHEYDADYGAAEVTEYHTNGSLMFTYTASGMSDPVGVTTDSANNVYAADYGSGAASIVVEFPQGSSTPIASCSTGLANEGIAVSSSGAVFVSGNNPNTGAGNILEYTNGLAGCPTPTTLGVTLGFAGGLQIDRHNNLVACDQFVGIDIIPAPYNAVSSTIGGFIDPFHVAINHHNGKIFVADVGAADVQVDLYPSGTPFMTVTNGLVDPAGVATNPYP